MSNNCTVANSTCTARNCACEATHYQVNTTLCAERKAPGGECTDSSQCVGNATCVGGGAGSSTCQCDSDFYADGSQCSARVDPNDGCTNSNQCVGNATCTGASGSTTCQCDSDFYPNGLQCSARIPVAGSCSISQQNCVIGALCDVGSTCRYRVGEKCTPTQPAELCQQGSKCINSGGSNYECRITAGSSLNCNNNSSLCVTTAVCETSACKTRVNQPCNISLPSCETNTTCARLSGGYQCRRIYGSDCTNSDECLKNQNQDCLEYGASSKKCLCSQEYFRQSSSNSCQNVNLLMVGNLIQDGNKMETSVMVTWTKPSVVGTGNAEYIARINTGQWNSWSGGLAASFSDLTPGEKYTVFVRTRTKKDPGYGNTTVDNTTPQELTVFTKPAKPGKLSPGVHSVPFVTLNFGASTGAVDYYIVTVKPNGGVKNVSSSPATFLNLTADKTYAVTIVAYSHGIMSDAQDDNFTVDASRAGAVMGLNRTEVGSRWSKVTWRKPTQPNGDIMGYTVRILFKNDRCASGVAVLCSDCGSISHTPSVTNCTEKSSTTYTKNELNSGSQEFQVNGTALQPDVSYKVRVNAYNQKGEGVGKEIDITTLQEAAPTLKNLALTTPGTKELLVSWVPGERTGPTTYNISWSEKQSLSSNVFLPKGSVVITGYEQRQHSITKDLLSYWEYEVSVFPFTPVDPPAQSMKETIRTTASEPAKVQFDIIKLEDSAERVNLTAQCPGERERNGPIEYISFNSTVVTQGAYEKNAPSGNIRVTESNCGGFQLVEVAAEASYLFTVFARTPNLSGAIATKTVTVDAKRPKLEKPSDVAALVEAGESKTRSVTIEVCPCVTSCKQGRIHMAGLIVCVKSATEKCLPERATDESKYDNFKTWKSFVRDQKGSYRLDFPNSTVQGCGRVKRSTEKFVPFIIGGDNTCDQKDEKYCNGPLPEGKEFVVIVWACTKAGCAEAEGVSVKTLAEESSNVGAIVGAVVSVLVIAIIVAVVVVLVLRHKQRFCFSKYGHPEPHSDLPPVRRPVRLRDFAAHLERLHKDSNLLFQEEFEDIQDRSPKHFPQEAALLDANKVKNRYVNILPFDHTRVKLSTDDDDETSDFINANYIPGYTSPREYIATQGPMVGTFADFWKMLWEQKSSLIVMLSDLQEKGRPKVDMYWPGDLHSPVQYDDIVVELTTTSTLNKYTIRTFRVYKEDQKEETRQVAQYFIPGWEDFSANLGPDHVLDFISSTRLEARNSQGPIIVHCSAGVGRTGTFIALDFLMQYVREHSLDDSVDIYNLVLNMRHNRSFMVQSEKQYIFIHDTLKVIIERKIREEEEHVYGNTSLDDIYVNQAFEPEENLYENTGFSPTTSL